MNITQPTVHLIAEPHIVWPEMSEYLRSIDGTQWMENVISGNGSEAELLVEFAGRSCYRSWKPGLNRNVKKVRTDSAQYLGNIISSRHGSVLEHAQLTFVFHNVSRVFTHELVRHRAGVAISQESLRFVRLDNIGLWIPPVVAGNPDIAKRWVSIVEQIEELQRDSAQAFGLDDDGVPFAYKKKVTSALRRINPMGLSTELVWSANFRTIRHVLEMRTDSAAEEEMRLVFGMVATIVKGRYPGVFQDYIHVGEGMWRPQYSKV